MRQRCSHRARMLLWVAEPSCRDPQGSRVAHSLYWVRVTSASTKSPSPIVDHTPGLNGLPWGRQSQGSRGKLRGFSGTAHSSY